MREISVWILPLILSGIILVGWRRKVPLYQTFVEGAQQGVTLTKEIIPTLVGLILGVRILRDSGLLSWLTVHIANIIYSIGIRIPPSVVPVVLVRMVSNSAATGLVLDIFKEKGPDSYEGMLASVLMSCTETILYTMSVYYSSVKITKTRWTLSGALVASLAGVIATFLVV